LSSPAERLHDPVGWHRAESTYYDADIPLWIDFTAEGKSAVLDLGCGTGRVAEELAYAGRMVVGLDNDSVLIDEFNRTVEGGIAIGVIGDALDLENRNGPLGKKTFDRIIAPQNLIQVIGDSKARRDLLTGIRSRLAPGGLVGMTFIEEMPEESLEPVPQHETYEADGWVWSSTVRKVRARYGSITLERIRELTGPDGESASVDYEIIFARMDTERLTGEIAKAGLELVGFRPVPTSPDYVDSVFVEMTLPEEPISSPGPFPVSPPE
jgi:SAM-dependent methyltransferase